MANSGKSIVGDLINFRGLVYAPLNENGVIFLFGKVAEDLNMYIEEIKPGFPDCIARRFTGKGWERLRVEFEYSSRNFDLHGHDANECDMIICWEDDWKGCPSSIEVIELRDRIKELENRPIQRPDSIGPEVTDIESWFEKHKVQQMPRELWGKLLDYVKSFDEEVFYRVGETVISVYSPERVFLYIYPRRRMLRFDVFTNGDVLGQVKQHQFEKGAEKWGGLSVASEDQLQAALAWFRESYERIKKAIANNEPTGWYAKVKEIGETLEEEG